MGYKTNLKWLNKLNNEQLVWAYEKEMRDLNSLLTEKRTSTGYYKFKDYIKYSYAYVNTLKVIAKTRNLKIK